MLFYTCDQTGICVNTTSPFPPPAFNWEWKIELDTQAKVAEQLSMHVYEAEIVKTTIAIDEPNSKSIGTVFARVIHHAVRV